MCLLIWTVFSGERCGPWASCFGFVFHVSYLPWFETKNKIRCIDAPKYAFTHGNLPESEKYIWIIKNVHENSRFFYIRNHAIIESRETRHSAVSAFTETVEFLQRSLASMLIIMRYCCSMIGCCCWGIFCIMFWNKRFLLYLFR